MIIIGHYGIISMVFNTMNCVDIFSGCGGLTLGLHRAGIKGIFAIEKSPDAFATLSYNLIDKQEHFSWPDWLEKTDHDINVVLSEHRKELSALKGKVDLLAGGPPCQGFSMAGRRRHDDRRNKLVNSYIEMVQLLKPRAILFENVKGFTVPFQLNKNHKQYSSYVVGKLQDAGYDVSFKLVNFSAFGVPQSRTRFILVGIRDDVVSDKCSAKHFFKLLDARKESFLAERGLSGRVSVEEAISDLLDSAGTYKPEGERVFDFGYYAKPSSSYQRLMRQSIPASQRKPDSHRFARHTDSITSRFAYAIENKLSSQAYREHFKLKKSSTKWLRPDRQTPTLTTLPDDYIHYCEPRILTVREYARIQSFPDDYEFKGKYTTGGKRRVMEVPRYSQIGNAIPPLFGEIAGLVLKEMCDG